MQKIYDPHQPLIRKALRIEWFLIVYNFIEGVVSVLAGLGAGSVALVGFGFDSGIELASALILVWRLRSHLAEDEAEKREKKALFLVGLTFFALAAYVGYGSVFKLIRQERPEESALGIVIAVLSLAIMPFLGKMKLRIAAQIGSKALKADAMETIVCAWLSAVLLAGLGLNALFGWWWADPAAGLAMLYFIVKEGMEAVRGAECCGSK